MVHPTGAGYFKLFAIDRQAPRRRESGKRIVVRGLTHILAFLADSRRAMRNRRLGWFEPEGEGMCFIVSNEGMNSGRVRLSLCAPLVDPYAKSRFIGSRLPQPFAAEFFRKMESLAGDVGDGEMGQIDVVQRPFRRHGLNIFRRNPTTKKSQLETERSSIRSVQVARVVPPLGPVARMRTVVSWKLIPIPSGRRFKRWRRRTGTGSLGTVDDKSSCDQYDKLNTPDHLVPLLIQRRVPGWSLMARAVYSTRVRLRTNRLSVSGVSPF
jgi:hypothetical protein